LALPEDVTRLTPEQLPKSLKLDGSSIIALKKINKETPEEYKKWVAAYIAKLNEERDKGNLIVLDQEEWQEERNSQQRDKLMQCIYLTGKPIWSLSCRSTIILKGGQQG